MFQVIAFVYENFWGGDACPELPTLQRQLQAVGFDGREVVEALVWLEGLKGAARGLQRSGSTNSPGLPAPVDALEAEHWSAAASSTRVFTADEQERLGASGWGLLSFLASIGALPQDRLELVMERVMATAGEPLSHEVLKLIVLMVYWSLNEEPDALVLDELCDNRVQRLAH